MPPQGGPRRCPMTFVHRSTTLCSISSILLLASLALSSPAALPAAAPIAVALPAPTADSDVSPTDASVLAGRNANLNVEARLVDRQYTYAPFSGAIYIVNPNGVQYSSGSPAQCPAAAAQVCGNIQVWNCCCPTGSACQFMSNNQIGCCPAGSACAGHALPSTITVTMTTTVWGAVPTMAQPRPLATTPQNQGVGGVFVNNGVTAATTAVNPTYYGTFCSTLTMRGHPIPTVVQGQCGSVLIVPPSAGSSLSVRWTLLSGLVLVQAIVGIFLV